MNETEFKHKYKYLQNILLDLQSKIQVEKDNYAIVLQSHKNAFHKLQQKIKLMEVEKDNVEKKFKSKLFKNDKNKNIIQHYENQFNHVMKKNQNLNYNLNMKINDEQKYKEHINSLNQQYIIL